MKKILPITTEIPIKTYNNIAYPLSIIFSNCNSPEDWLFFNSFSLKYGTEVSDLTLDLPYNIDWDCFERNKLANNIAIADIISEITNGYYIYLAVDEKFIPYRASFQKQNFIHDILVYGFDDAQKVFYIIGFNEQKKYVVQEIDFSLLDMAIKSANKIFSYGSFVCESFGAGNNYSLKFKSLDCDILSIDYQNLSKLLLLYLNGKEFYSHTGYVCYSGILIYSKMLKDEESISDFRNWNILREHKEFIFKYLQTNFSSLVECEKMQQLVINVRNCLNLSVKYYVDKRKKSLIRLKDSTKSLYELDKNIYENLLDKVEKLRCNE